MSQVQVKEGIDAVIVDSVLAIRKGLTKDEGLEVVKETSPEPEPKGVEKMVIEDGEEVKHSNGTASVDS
jgi:hypothetical protein